MGQYIQKNWTPEKPYCIYKHISPSGKVYIGQTKQKNLNKRWRNGNIYGYCQMSIFRKVIDKYGWENIQHEIIEEGLTKQEADLRECYWIQYYKELNLSYNVSNGGDGCSRKMSDETKEKIARAHLGKKRGPHSPEWNENISKNRKGISNPPEAIQRAIETRKRNGTNKASQETKEKMSLIFSNRMHINNGVECKFVKIDEADKYLNDGWVKGRLKLKFKDPLTPSKIRKGKIHINNGVKNKFICPNELNEYLNNGWIKGNLITIKNRDKYRHLTGKIRIYKDNMTKFIHPEELDKYLNIGWNKYKGSTKKH